MANKIQRFDLAPGRIVALRYHVMAMLGAGSEGEVYKVLEKHTGIVMALKLFYPHKNIGFKVSARISRKLSKLKESPIVVDYVSHDIITIRGLKVACLSCEYIDGQILSHFISRQRGQRLGIFAAIHLLYSVVVGVESIHLLGEYHGDLHTDNIIIKNFGLEFDLKIIDLHHWGDSKQDNRDEDIVKVIKIFYESLGGSKHYTKLPPSVKFIICGLKRSIILKRFKTITSLRMHLELMDWSDAV